MNPGYSEFISVGKFSVGFYWGWYVREWAELPTPTAANPEEKTWMWVRRRDPRNPVPFPKMLSQTKELDRYCKSSNLITRDLFRQLTGVEICKWDMYHSEAA